MATEVLRIPIGGGRDGEDDSWWQLDKALGLIRATKADASEVVPPRGRPAGDDQQQTGLLVVPPPLALDALAKLPQENSTLLQCILAMATNVDGYGYDLEYVGPPEEEEPTVAQKQAPPFAKKPAKAVKPPKAPPKTPTTGPESAAAKEEAVRIRTFLLTCNARESFDSLRRKLRMDLESTGNGFWEVLRDGDDEIAGLEHLPAYTMRLCPLDRYTTEVEAEMIGVDGELVTRTVQMRFRRYVQIQQGRYVYFKELGDARVISAANGTVLEGEGAGQPLTGVPDRQPTAATKYETLPLSGPIPSGLAAAQLAPVMQPDDPATEVLHFVNVYCPDSPYGLTKFVGNIPAIRGSRYTELVNLQLFRKNAIPAMMVLIGGGGLNVESKQQIKDYFRDEYQGLANVQRVLVLEAVTQNAPIEGQRSSVTIDVQPMQQYGQDNDGYFLNYGKQARESTMACFRLPPIYLGYAADTSYANAQASRVTAEEQVFQPERAAFDEVINLRLLRPMGVRFWKFFSKGPEIADVATYTAAMQAFSAMGAMTPNIAIDLMNELLGTEIDRVPEEQKWGDYPFPIVLGLLGQGKLAGLDEIEKEGPDPLELMKAQAQMVRAQGGGPPAPFGGKPGAKPAAGGPPKESVPEEGQTKRPEKPEPGATPVAKSEDGWTAEGLTLEALAISHQDVMRGLALIQHQLAMQTHKGDLALSDLARGGGLLGAGQGRRLRRRRGAFAQVRR